MPVRRVAILSLFTLLLCGATAAAAGWDIRAMGGGDRAAVNNAADSITLSIFCGGDGAMVGITRRNTVPWTQGEPVELVVGDETFPIAPFTEGDTWGVFNLDPSLKPALVAALRAGAQLTLRGGAASAIGDADLAFSLAGSSRALDAVPGGCT